MSQAGSRLGRIEQVMDDSSLRALIDEIASGALRARRCGAPTPAPALRRPRLRPGGPPPRPSARPPRSRLRPRQDARAVRGGGRGAAWTGTDAPVLLTRATDDTGQGGVGGRRRGRVRPGRGHRGRRPGHARLPSRRLAGRTRGRRDRGHCRSAGGGGVSGGARARSGSPRRCSCDCGVAGLHRLLAEAGHAGRGGRRGRDRRNGGRARQRDRRPDPRTGRRGAHQHRLRGRPRRGDRSAQHAVGLLARASRSWASTTGTAPRAPSPGCCRERRRRTADGDGGVVPLLRRHRRRHGPGLPGRRRGGRRRGPRPPGPARASRLGPRL